MYQLMCFIFFLFFFNETATTEIYTYRHTLSLHDALPILYRQTDLVKIMRDTVIYFALTPQELSEINADSLAKLQNRAWKRISNRPKEKKGDYRSEEHTSELQSLMRISNAVFCLKKKTTHH